MRLILIACLLSLVRGQATDGDEQCCNLVEFMGHVIIQRNQPLTTELSSLVDFLSFKLCDDSPFVVQLWKPSALTEGEDDSLCAPENSYTLLWEKTITPDSSLIAGQWYKVILEEKITLHPDYRLGFASVNGQSEVLSVPYMIPTSLASSLKAVAIDDKAFSTYSPGDSMCAVTLNNAKSFDTFTLFCKEEIDDQGEVVSECYNSNIIPPATVVGPPGPPGPPGADGKDGEPGPPGIPGECCQDWSFDQTLKPSCDLGDSFVTTMNDIKAELESVSQKLENGQGISTGLSSGVCPGQSWIPGSFGLGNCYIPLFDADEAQWAETMFNCVDLLDDKDEDVYVIDIISEVENNFLVSQILKLMPPADQLKKTESWSVWTSAMFSEKENSWLWRVSSKEQFPFHYYNWRDNKPPEPESTIPKNNCVVLVVERDPDGAERNFWEVRHCKEKARTMCKIPKKCH